MMMPKGSSVQPGGWNVLQQANMHRNPVTAKKISTWNARSLHQAGKPANVAKEMIRMDIDVLGVSETFWKNTGHF